MKIYKADTESIEKAASILKNGGLVAFPTETVYGLGADATNQEAVEKIFTVKKRPASNPLIIHTHSFQNILNFADIGDKRIAKRLEKISIFWPGPLTAVVPRGPLLTSAISKSSNTAAFRIPAHETALQLLKICDLPIAAPSANTSGYISPTTAAHVNDGMGNEIDMILDGGPCGIGIESTVIGLVSDIPVILRPGAINKEELEAALSEKVNYFLSQTPLLSPGMLEEHYSPSTPLIFSDQVEASYLTEKRIGIITFGSGTNLLQAKEIVQINLDSDPKLAANGLYSAMRNLDSQGLDLILVDKMIEEGLGIAIMDRLKRAAKK
jgi:L-threonylcarbamoyladenylate synthase